MNKSEKLFKRLLDEKALMLESMANEMQQRVEFYEHPTMGDMAPVIVCFPDYELAFESDFYDLDDMMSDRTYEYRPFLNGESLMMYGYEIS
jgi:hypothetical protein